MSPKLEILSNEEAAGDPGDVSHVHFKYAATAFFISPCNLLPSMALILIDQLAARISYF